MQRVIWGAGIIGKRLFASLKDIEQIEFLIDSDPRKRGMYQGKEIRHPEDIVNWKQLFIYVPDNFYEEISSFLKTKGLVENENFKKYTGWSVKRWLSSEQVLNGFDVAIKNLEIVSQKYAGKSICFIFEGGGASIYPQLRSGLEFNWIIETLSDIQDKKCERFLQSNIPRNILYTPLFASSFSRVMDARLQEAEWELLARVPYLNNIAEQIKDDTFECSIEGCLFLTIYQYRYLNKLIECFKPPQIICPESVGAFHVLIKEICSEHEISTIFTHPGVFPGTFNFDIHGEMGESLPAIYWKQFRDLPVEKDDMQGAQKVWGFLYQSKLNRKIQQPNKNSRILEKIKKDAPVIFYAGCNDNNSHMVPYTLNTQKFHSPIFHSSIEAAIYLADICEKNGWNLIFKPHPQYVRNELKNDIPKNLIYIEQADINELIDLSDVTITILSATSYNALIRYKPVVMLGYTQLRGKGCTYEAFQQDEIEDAIKAALKNGFTHEQQDAFLLHMAQCLKYYLYDDLQERPIRYGRPVPKSFDEVYELERLLRFDEGKEKA